MTTKKATLYFNQGQFKFSSGHFTIFSQTHREPLHGHNYSVEIKLTATLSEPGITFDYRLLKDKINQLCKELNWHTLIPKNSPYLRIDEDGEHYHIIFNHQSMWLLKTDVVILPLENITLETLSEWFFLEISKDRLFFEKYGIDNLVVKILNGPYHAAES